MPSAAVPDGMCKQSNISPLVRVKAETERALVLNPNYALAYGTRGLVEVYLGHPLAAISFIERAYASNGPFAPHGGRSGQPSHCLEAEISAPR